MFERIFNSKTLILDGLVATFAGSNFQIVSFGIGTSLKHIMNRGRQACREAPIGSVIFSWRRWRDNRPMDESWFFVDRQVNLNGTPYTGRDFAIDFYRSVSNPAVDQRIAFGTRLWKNDALSILAMVICSNMMGRIDWGQQSHKLQIRMHGKETPSKVLRTLAILQQPSHKFLWVGTWMYVFPFFLFFFFPWMVFLVSICQCFSLLFLVGRTLMTLLLFKVSPSPTTMVIVIDVAVVSQFVIKYNNLVHMINGGRPSNLTH
mmetsp:Transcript_11443/g.20213  ORF Transcript_11443/g.20213 Transcript_11443/m.20213 type:complete len:261 (+) Transcript_11443:1625-2407(+)